MKKTVYLQGIGGVEHSILMVLKRRLEKALKGFISSVEISSNPIPLYVSEYDEKRRQYNAREILSRLNKIFKKSNQFRVLGIIDEDIYSSSQIFLFGNAKKGNLNRSRASLISTTRFKESFYRRPNNEALFELRILKEAFHELGHTFGLRHCENDCIMRSSKSLAEADKRPPFLCDSCLALMNDFFKKIP